MIKLYILKGFLSLFSLGIVVCLWFFPLDHYARNIVDSSLKEAVIVFGVAKGLNAAVSIAQGTQITAIPGFIFAIGEALDPLNDLIEQFSWVMLASITSLGLQKILYNMVTGELYTYVLMGSLLGFHRLAFPLFCLVYRCVLLSKALRAHCTTLNSHFIEFSEHSKNEF